MQRTVEAWKEDAYLVRIMAGNDYVADVNDNTHFMYFHKGKAKRERNYKNPTTEELMSMTSWFERAHATAGAVYQEESAQIPDAWRIAAELRQPGSGLNPLTSSRSPSGKFTVTRAAKVSASHTGVAINTSMSSALVTAPWLPVSREKRTLYYLRASADPKKQSDNAWIPE
jgi:hypothetical protein